MTEDKVLHSLTEDDGDDIYEMVAATREYVDSDLTIDPEDTLHFFRGIRGYEWEEHLSMSDEEFMFAPIRLTVGHFKQLTDKEVVQVLLQGQMTIQ